MKKLLALVLALVMTLSLCTVSNAAYSDAADVDYKEAVDVMTAIGVFNGTDGKFNPDGILTREQAAKIVTYMLLGKTAADALATIAAPFADVAADRWSAGSIAYCYNEGILAGVGEGKFDPAGQLTGLAFAKMMLVALGYDAEVEGLTGANWSINAAKLALTTGLTDDLDDVALTAPMTREQAAKMAFNTEKATLVEYDNASTITAGNVTIKTQSKATFVNDAAYANNLLAANTQFAEKYCSKLALAVNDTTDAMNHPANTWTYKNIKVGTYVAEADLTFVVGKTNKTFAELITAENEDLTFATASATIVSINGEDTKTAIDAATNGATGPYVGDVVEVYLSSTTANQVANVIVTRYSAAKVTGAVQTKTTDGVDYVRVPGVINSYTDVKKVNGYEGLEKGDVVYYYMDVENNNYFLAKAEKVTGKLTAYTAATASSGMKFTINDKQYKVNESVGGVDGLCTNFTTLNADYNTEYDFYLDNNGYVVYGVATESEKSDYVVLQNIGVIAASGVTTEYTAEARLVKMDGTTDVVKVAKVDTITGVATGDDDTKLIEDTNTTADISDTVQGYIDKRFFTYTINSDGEYELTSVTNDAANKLTVDNGAGKTVTNKSATIPTLCAVNNDTVFVVAKSTGGKTFEVYTGKDAVPSMTAVSAAYVAKNGIATYVYVDAYTGKTTSGDGIFFLSATPKAFNTAKDGTTTYTFNTYDAVVNGEMTVVKVKASAINNVTADGDGSVATGTLVKPTYDKYGVAVTLTASANDQAVGYGYNYANGSLYVADGTTGSYSCTEDTVLFYKDEDGNYVKGTFADYASDDNDAIYVVVKGTSGSDATTVDYAYVQYVDDADVSFTVTCAKADDTPVALTQTTNTWAATGVAKSNAHKITVNVNGLLTVKFSTDNSTFTADEDGVYTVTTSASASTESKIYFKIVAVDGTESAVQTVSLTTVAG